MSWAAGPDDFHLDPRAFEAGGEAVGLFSMVRSWISQALTDGHIPRGTALGYARALGIADPEAAFTRLVDTGLWARSGSADFADVRYLENNPSKARVEEKKALTKKRQADWKERNKGKKMSDNNASQSHNNASLTRDSRVTNAATQTPAQAPTQERSQNARDTPARTPERSRVPTREAGREGGGENPSHEPEPQTLPADARAPLAGHDGTTPGGLNVQTTKRPVNGRVGARPRAAAQTEIAPGRWQGLPSLMRRLEDLGPYPNAKAMHDGVQAELEALGFACDREFYLPDDGRGRRGFIDLVARIGDVTIAFELDRGSPRENSVRKLSCLPDALHIVLLREPGDMRAPKGIDAVGLVRQMPKSAEPDHEPPEVVSKARQIELNHARYASHYSAGVAAATGGAHEVATPYERGVLAGLLGKHAREPSGDKLKGPELDAWLRAEGEAFARATMPTRHMQRGFSPSKFGEWLNAGRPGATPANGSGPSGAKWARLA